jgi:hypothetical protein
VGGPYNVEEKRREGERQREVDRERETGALVSLPFRAILT